MLDNELIENAMRLAVSEAEFAVSEGNPPFGAVLLDQDGHVAASGHNTQKSTTDPAAHAEINVLRLAGNAFGRLKFPGFTMVGNAEPCAGCASFCIKSEIRSLVYGTDAEQSMEPWMRVADIAAAARNGFVELAGGVLLPECTKVLVEGRATLAARAD